MTFQGVPAVAANLAEAFARWTRTASAARQRRTGADMPADHTAPRMPQAPYTRAGAWRLPPGFTFHFSLSEVIMESKARLLGHPIHQMLIVFPLGLLGASVLFDLAYRLLDMPILVEVAYWTMAGGLIGGVIAAPFGLLDWLAIPKGTRAKTVGMLHGAGNVIVLLLFLGSWLMRRDAVYHLTTAATAMAVVGLALSMVTAWLGGELVDRLGVGISDRANLDAPSSLRKP
jgi:uncharacterized membrane protein